LVFLKELKNVKRGRIREYARRFKREYHEGQRPWGIARQVALPCATQNELDGANTAGCRKVAEAMLDQGIL
jgi:glutamate dehydrogenase (NADP+)